MYITRGDGALQKYDGGLLSTSHIIINIHTIIILLPFAYVLNEKTTYNDAIKFNGKYRVVVRRAVVRIIIIIIITVRTGVNIILLYFIHIIL